MSLYERWLTTYQTAYRKPSTTPTLPCPTCAARTLTLLFVVRRADTLRATALFWCNTCQTGLAPNRAPLPPNAPQVREGEEQVPNYTIVPPP
ncbi:hypothetical protein GCM10010492_47710 [Saccharothrix mutabilis subsp. mutabilis]|uniref:Uncharacterized protein n=1 Tax=Saccharothrix mutabilis subsp. mutabilis TaxID=66855 RepID=A0ABN0U978_9PSEU